MVVAKRKIINGTVEYQQEYEFIQDPKNPLSDEQVQNLLLKHYLSLFPIYEGSKKFINTVFVIKTMGRIFGTVRTLRKRGGQ